MVPLSNMDIKLKTIKALENENQEENQQNKNQYWS